MDGSTFKSIQYPRSFFSCAEHLRYCATFKIDHVQVVKSIGGQSNFYKLSKQLEGHILIEVQLSTTRPIIIVIIT
jgi:hypothetical protein